MILYRELDNLTPQGEGSGPLHQACDFQRCKKKKKFLTALFISLCWPEIFFSPSGEFASVNITFQKRCQQGSSPHNLAPLHLERGAPGPTLVSQSVRQPRLFLFNIKQTLKRAYGKAHFINATDYVHQASRMRKHGAAPAASCFR